MTTPPPSMYASGRRWIVPALVEEVSEAYEFRRAFGLAFRPYCRLTAVTALVPLNLVIALAVGLWRGLYLLWPASAELRDRRHAKISHDAYTEGWTRGYHASEVHHRGLLKLRREHSERQREEIETLRERERRLGELLASAIGDRDANPGARPQQP